MEATLKAPQSNMQKTHNTPPVACVHFWLIDEPHGPTSHGVCTLCGAERDFQNSITDAGYNYEQDRMLDIWLPGSRRLE